MTKTSKTTKTRLILDGRRRISLSKLVPEKTVSVSAYMEGDKIILVPLVEIPASELWLYKNKDALEAVQEGLKQSKEGKLRSRGSYAGDDI